MIAIVSLLLVTAFAEPADPLMQKGMTITVDGKDMKITNPSMDAINKFLDTNFGPGWHSLMRPQDRVVNYPDVVRDDVGYFGYWCLLIGFFCMALSTAYFYVAAQNARGGKFFEVLTMAITGIATLAYLMMFSGAGKMWVEEVPGTETPVYWGRYVDWVLTTPLMLWDILALAGAPNDEIAMALMIDALMIGFGVVGAQTPDQNKWFFFLFGCGCFVHIVKVLLKYSSENKYGEEARALYNKVAWMTIVLWTLYPVVWVIAEGQRMVSASMEACLYCIMDVSAKCVFGFIIVQGRTALEAINNAEKGM